MTQQNNDPNGSVLLTVIIPAYNEARTLAGVLKRVLTVPIEKELIIVNDASTDDTAAVLQQWATRSKVRVITHEINRGKGAAIRTGLAHATGKYTIIQDADLEYYPEDYPSLLEPLMRGDAEVVYGSRYLADPGCDRGAQRSLFRYGVSLLNIVVHLLYGDKLTDEATCYKVIPTPLLKSLDLQCERFEFCPEVTAKICRCGIKIWEVPIRYSPRSKKEGKKIRYTDGIEAIQTLWRWRRWQRVCENDDDTQQSPHARKAEKTSLIRESNPISD